MNPWMSDREIQVIEGILKNDLGGKANAVEWGSGGSTLRFSPMTSQWTSIEHDPEWFRKVEDEFGGLDRVRAIHVPPDSPHEGFTPAVPGQFKTYREAVKGCDADSINFAMIDGRDRIECINGLCESGVLRDGAFIVLHDSNRNRYRTRFHEFHKYLTIDRERSSGEGVGLTVFRKLPEQSNDISVIVTAFNASKFLEECLRSVDSQEFSGDFECVVGIDGCESTRAKFLEIKDTLPNVRGIFFRKNQGTYITSNSLIEHCRFDWIQRFDADDIMLPGFIQYASNCVEPGIHFYGFKHLEFTDGAPGRKPISRAAEGQSLMSRKFLNILGAWKPWKCGADTDITSRAAAFGFERKINSIYSSLRRRHPDSLTIHPSTGHGSPIRNHYERKISHRAETVERVTNNDFELL